MVWYGVVRWGVVYHTILLSHKSQTNHPTPNPFTTQSKQPPNPFPTLSLPPRMKIEVSEDQQEHTLTIRNACLTDAGSYSCRWQSRVSEADVVVKQCQLLCPLFQCTSCWWFFCFLCCLAFCFIIFFRLLFFC